MWQNVEILLAVFFFVNRQSTYHCTTSYYMFMDTFVKRQDLLCCYLQIRNIFHMLLNSCCYFFFLFPAGFALQAYRGAQKPSPMEVMKTQATRLADNPTAQAACPPKMEIPTVEGRRQGARPHKLKPRDMNILTPSGFWEVTNERRSLLHSIVNVSPFIDNRGTHTPP